MFSGLETNNLEYFPYVHNYCYIRFEINIIIFHFKFICYKFNKYRIIEMFADKTILCL